MAAMSRRVAITVLLCASTALADDLDRARKMLRDRDVEQRLRGVAALVALDTKQSIDLLEEAIRTSMREMDKGSNTLDRLLALQLKMLPRARRLIKQLDAGINVLDETDAWLRKFKQTEDEILRTTADTRVHLQVVHAAGEGFRSFRNADAIRLIERGALTEVNPLLRQYYIAGLRDKSRSACAPSLLQILDNKDPRARAIAVRSLIPLAREPGVADRVKLLRADPNWAVRLGASQAMAGAPFAEAVEYLVGTATSETGEIACAADSYLFALTGTTYAQRPGHWKTWWEQNAEAVRAGKWARAAAGAKSDEARTVASFFRIPLDSDRIVFALDFSGSMSEPLELKDKALQKLIQQHGLELTRLGYAQAEFIRAITTLRDGIFFNVLGFNDDAKRFNHGMIKLDAASRARAIRWVTSLETAELTNIFEALQGSFADYLDLGSGAERFKDLPDTVVFLTDGVATRGRFTEPDDLLALVVMWNKPLDIVFHCVGIGEDHDKKLLKGLAARTGGYYVDTSKGLAELKPRRRAPPPEVGGGEPPAAEPEVREREPEPEEKEPKAPARKATAVDALVDLLDQGDAEERVRAARALGQLGPAAAPAVETLVTALQDVSPEVQVAAADALGAIGKKAVPHLLAVLAVDDVDCITLAARALAIMGPAAREALPALEKHKDHEDARIRDAVRDACAKISG